MKHAFYDAITSFIFVEDKPEKADVIFLPGGAYPESAVNAARLYREGYAPYVLPSGRWARWEGRFLADPRFDTEWEYLRDILLKHGVPDSAILKEDRATFTWENAIYSRILLENEGIKAEKAILSCQNWHARRCLLYYQEQFPDTDILVCPVETKGITRDNWYLDEDKIDRVLGEVERCGSQFHDILKSRLRP